MRPSTTLPLKKCLSMLLTSSERGWPATSCQPGFSPWAEEQEGGGKGAKGWTSCHFFSFFFSLNKCHFLRQRRNRGHFRYPFLWGRLLPQAPSLLPKTLIHFPSQSPNPRGSSHPSQIPLKMIQGGYNVTQPHLLDQIRRENP